MGIELIGLITIAVAGLAVLRSAAMALSVMCCMGLLGAASAMAFGSANITPGHLSLAFFFFAVLIREKAFAYGSMSINPGRPGLILAVLSAWALVSSVVLPRLFAGQFFVFPMNSQNSRIMEVPLQATGSNFNQAVYFLAGLLIFLAVTSMARTPKMLERAAMAIIACSIFNLIIVFVDTATFAVGMSSLLDFIRNADYAQLFSHQFMGIKRVTGSYPEASSYVTAAAGLFAFNFRLWRGGIKPQLTGLVALLTFVSILFAFSSTGYVTLAVYLSIAYAVTISGLDNRSSSSPFSMINRRVFVSLGPLIALAGAMAVALKPDLLDPIIRTFDNSIASKLNSASGIERTSWNMGGFRAFFESYGLGAGTGSVRTSSFAVGVLANLGVIGAGLFALFFYGLFRSKPELQTPLAGNEARQYASAARAGCFSILLAATVSGATIDLGIHFYVMAGIACASLFYRRPAHQALSTPAWNNRNGGATLASY